MSLSDNDGLYINLEPVNLLQYFDGELASTNRGGKCGVVGTCNEYTLLWYTSTKLTRN
jgi:hypothetical protein